MSNNKGQMFEDEIVYQLNNRKVKSLPRHFKYILQELFGYLDEEEYVECSRTTMPIKPDVVIIYKGEKKFLSIKKQGAEVLHGENIKPFILFLRSLGVSKDTQKTILLYQYGDGTMDGSGKIRYDFYEVLNMYEQRIDEAKKELNNKELMIQIVVRIIFEGVDPNADKADAIYVGDGENGSIVTRRQMIKYLRKKSWRNWDSFHIGPIIIRPHARYVGRDIANPNFRNRVDCYWPNLADDLKYISRRFFSYTPKNKREE